MSRTGAQVARLPLSRFTTLGVGGESEVWTVSDPAQLATEMTKIVDDECRVLGIEVQAYAIVEMNGFDAVPSDS